MAINRSQIALCPGPVVACLCDLTVTLSGQSEEYWSGNWSAVKEGNPIPHWLLSQHPLALCAGIAVWVTLFCTAIIRLRPPVARVVALVVMLGHATAASTWLLRMQPFGTLYAICLLILLKLIDHFTVTRADPHLPDAEGSQSVNG